MSVFFAGTGQLTHAEVPSEMWPSPKPIEPAARVAFCRSWTPVTTWASGEIPIAAATSAVALYAHGDRRWCAGLATDRLHALPPSAHAVSAQPRALPSRTRRVPPTAIAWAEVAG